MLHQPGAGLHILGPAQAGIVGRRRNPDHARIDAERGADVLAAHAAQIRELKVRQREAKRLNIFHRPKERGRAALAAIHDPRAVAVLHGGRVVLRRLVRQQHGKRGRTVVGDDLPHVLRRLVVRRHARNSRRAARKSEHVGRKRPRHFQILYVDDRLGRHLHDNARPVAVIVPARVALAVHPHRLQRLGIDRAQPHRPPLPPAPFHLDQRVAVPEEVDRQPGAEGAGRKARSRVIQQPLQRVRLADPAFAVAPFAQHHQRHRGHEVRHDADTGVNDRVLAKALRANRRAVGLVLLRIGCAHQRRRGRPWRQRAKRGAGRRHRQHRPRRVGPST